MITFYYFLFLIIIILSLINFCADTLLRVPVSVVTIIKIKLH